MSFWGLATLPDDSDIGRFITAIDAVMKGQGRQRRREFMTRAITALVMYVAEHFGPRDALAIVDALRSKIIERAS